MCQNTRTSCCGWNRIIRMEQCTLTIIIIVITHVYCQQHQLVIWCSRSRVRLSTDDESLMTASHCVSFVKLREKNKRWSATLALWRGAAVGYTTIVIGPTQARHSTESRFRSVRSLAIIAPSRIARQSRDVISLDPAEHDANGIKTHQLCKSSSSSRPHRLLDCCH